MAVRAKNNNGDNEAYEHALFMIVKDEKALSIPCREADLSDRSDKHEVDKIVRDLLDTADGLQKGDELTCWGLAANQRGYDLRVCIVWDDKKKRFMTFVNPELLLKQKKFESEEGCYSFPGKTAKVVRYKEIKVRDASGKILKLRGMQAVAFQHELDHLNGVLI